MATLARRAGKTLAVSGAVAGALYAYDHTNAYVHDCHDTR